MASDLQDAIKQLVEERGISEDLVLKTIENFILAAYKRKFGTQDNVIVKFSDDMSSLSVYAKKVIVEDDDFEDPVLEIELSEAKTLDPEAEPGDELLIEIDPKEFDRISVQSAKQTARQSIRDIQKDTLYSEFKDKVGEMIIGYYQREKNGTIYVDLGKTEGIMPRKFQSPREQYHPKDRIKALIVEVKKNEGSLQIVLSRTHPEFVKAIFELEVPEIYDNTVEIYKIVREPGYRTKIAVFSHRDDVDPVGACVGLKGVRIQAIIRELEGEKIDILKYDPDPKRFIKNALSPAEVLDVIILDEVKKNALVIVPDSQLSLAIGKQGLNVRLANRLCDWNIDVKTEEQYQELDLAADSRLAVSRLFGEAEEEITRLDELSGIAPELVKAFESNGVTLIEDFLALDEAMIAKLEGVSPEDIDTVRALIAENVEVREEEAPEGAKEEAEESEDEAYEFECPECGATVSPEMTSCPSCGVGLSFEYEEE
jgi:N utilization substance protein A